MYGSSSQCLARPEVGRSLSIAKTAYGDAIITVPPSLGATYSASPPGRNISISVVPGSVAGSGTLIGPPPGLLVLENEGTGTGLIFDKVVGNVAFVRSLQAGTNIAIATIGENIVIDAVGPPISSQIWQYVTDTNSLGSSVILNPTYPGAVIPSDLVYPGTSTEENPPPFDGITLIFDASNGAFRAGSVDDGQWTQANRGAQSASFGLNNTASGSQTFIGAGSSNIATALSAFVGAGTNNTASARDSFVGAGSTNSSSALGAVVIGGSVNFASGDFAIIGAGSVNMASGENSFVGAGTHNTASNSESFVGSGMNNTASGEGAFIGAGGTFFPAGNTASGSDSFVGAGDGNAANGIGAFVGAGGTLGGGNTANGQDSFIGSGITNAVSASGAFVGAGASNSASGVTAFVGAGESNTASELLAFVGAGTTNTAGANAAFVGAGANNMALGTDSFVGAGTNNTASGSSSFIGGGNLNTAAGAESFVGGSMAADNGNANCFVWSDSGGLVVPITSANTAWFRVGSAVTSATQVFTIYTAPGTANGVTLAPGGSAWAGVCDRNAKENLRLLNSTDVLSRVEALPVYEYNYKGTDSNKVCRGPTAQDWHELFPSEKDPLRIDTGDLDGIALAAIKGLSKFVRELQTEVAALKTRLTML